LKIHVPMPEIQFVRCELHGRKRDSKGVPLWQKSTIVVEAARIGQSREVTFRDSSKS
jgi:hypothetical protein